MRLDLSPWARREVDPVVQEILRTMEPRGGTVHIGRGRDHWRALATLNGYVLADVTVPFVVLPADPNVRKPPAYGANAAAEKLIERMTPPDGMTEAKARDDLRDGVAHFEWHGHDIEVDVS